MQAMTDLKTALAALKATVGTPAATPSSVSDKPRNKPRGPAGSGARPPAQQDRRQQRPRSAPATALASANAVNTAGATEGDADGVNNDSETLSETGSNALNKPPQQKSPQQAAPRQAPRCMPTLEKLALLYPPLFGEVFLPMKRGIYQDLLAAHPTEFEKEHLKEALAFHSRSTRYLNAVASGAERHDLTGAAVEAMAPEHVYHALMEVFRRRQGRAPTATAAGLGDPTAQTRLDPRGRPMEDPRAKLIKRIVAAMDTSGLPRAAYFELVRGKDEAAKAILDEAMQLATSRAAKDEATHTRFKASGQTVEEFAAAYGMHPKAVSSSLERAEFLSKTPEIVTDSAQAAIE